MSTNACIKSLVGLRRRFVIVSVYVRHCTHSSLLTLANLLDYCNSVFHLFQVDVVSDASFTRVVFCRYIQRAFPAISGSFSMFSFPCVLLVYLASCIHNIGCSGVTESMVTMRSPFCGYDSAYCVELKGEDL